MLNIDNAKIAVIGLGYVGLPLAVEFGKHYPTIGFDINQSRINALQGGTDTTLEVEAGELSTATKLTYTANPDDLKDCNVYIITVPTPIDTDKNPDISLLIKASETVGHLINNGDVVIYESTVYPGATEEDCIPVIEEISELTLNNDFYVGYSPERINPGDKTHRLPSIKKVTSGSTPEAAQFINALYQTIITAGTHLAPSIKVAEAAKVIENTQRDVNIALINELAIIFEKLEIDTQDVLEAAGTKWNFLPFRPGLVGGHCIGVDPYYLTHKSETVGYSPEIILAGRRLNDGMGAYVASQLVKAMLKRTIQIDGARVLIMGLTFKENCPDIRNTRVIDVVRELKDYGIKVDVYDPWANAKDAKDEYDIDIISTPNSGAYDGIIIAVAHSEFRAMKIAEIREFGKLEHVLYDLKYVIQKSQADIRL